MADLEKECNLLCSGPSRISYKENNIPTMGCNIPWAKVNWTIIFDSIVLEKIIDFPDFLHKDTKLIISNHAKSEMKLQNKLNLLKHDIAGTFRHHYSTTHILKRSTGHYAAEWLIHMGYTKINIYGCDNWFGDDLCLENYMHDESNPLNIPNENIEKGINYVKYRGYKWRKSWQRLINQNPNIEFNFIP